MNLLHRSIATLLLAAGPIACAPAWSAPQPPPAVHVTGKLRSFNGATDVPPGLFGTHAMKLDDALVEDWGIESARFIDQAPSAKPRIPGQNNLPARVRTITECFYDRYQPALLLTDRNWKQKLETLGQTYAQNATQANQINIVEFWNEPFLNWATRPGVNYDANFYEAAGREVGKPMTIKGWEKPLEYLVWSKQLRLVDPKSGNIHYLSNGDPPLPGKNLKAGEMYNFRGKEFRMEELWWGKDTSQHSYYSGKQNAQFYRWMLVSFAKGIKDTNPKIPVVAGWGFGIHSNGWKAWDDLFKPTIDDSIQYIDGIGEHHYGGDTRAVAASYEVAYAYALAKYDKRLKFYNTEAGGSLDPQRPDTPARSFFTGKTVDEAKGHVTYFVRDIVHMIDALPDKAITRADHSPDGNAGDQWAFRFLKDLRGKLLVTASDVPGVWAVASLSGKTMTLVLFNDNRQATDVPLDIAAPAGTAFVSARRVDVGSTPASLQLDEQKLPAAGQHFSASPNITAKWMVKYVLELDSAPASLEPAVAETQFVADQILTKVAPDAPATLKVNLPKAALATATRAKLRLIAPGWTDASALTLNGKPLAIPSLTSGINDVSVEPGLLTEQSTLTFTAKSAAFQVDAASIILVQDKP